MCSFGGEADDAYLLLSTVGSLAAHAGDGLDLFAWPVGEVAGVGVGRHLGRIGVVDGDQGGVG